MQLSVLQQLRSRVAHDPARLQVVIQELADVMRELADRYMTADWSAAVVRNLDRQCNETLRHTSTVCNELYREWQIERDDLQTQLDEQICETERERSGRMAAECHSQRSDWSEDGQKEL